MSGSLFEFPQMGGHAFFISFIKYIYPYIIVEKKWHRSPKMDKNKCPKIKSAKEILQKTSLKNPL